MIPSLDSPKWDTFFEHIEEYGKQTSNIATKMLLSRLRVKLKFNASQDALEELKKTAYDFFVRNEKIVASDISAIFG